MVTAGVLLGPPSSTQLLLSFRRSSNGIGSCGGVSNSIVETAKGPKLLYSPFSTYITSSSSPQPPPPSLCLPSPSSSFDSFVLTSSVGSPPLLAPPRSRRHVLLLNVAACTAAISTSWLFLSAIPMLLACKRAAESLEKLLDVTREELPDTMAAVRLSGMEISDLTMELSDLGQEITQGVRSSTRAVRLAEDRLRGLTIMSPAGSSHNKEKDR